MSTNEIFNYIRSKVFDPDDNKPIDGLKREIGYTVIAWLHKVEDELKKEGDK